MAITAIETYYAGHLFRSRLEARWATVFNDLGIRWEYEPQGFRVGEQQRPYLPDFLLPDIGWWVEVKGTAERLDMSLLTDAVHPTKGVGPDGSVTNLLILGPIPDTCRATPLHFSVSQGAYCGQLHRCSDDCDFPPPLYGLDYFLAIDDLASLGTDLTKIRPSDLETWRKWGAYPIPYGRPSFTVPRGDLTRTLLDPRMTAGPHLEAAYTLGRTARFEHGANAA
ncbi:hypothetical protein ACFVYT_24745 [Streptomyces sp. NPDC058290]|uniref:hypothetical protein n=1 Tax=Streptomyces sp. NPDC058290 TaxID=3346426 RepID=UPI0036E4B623